MATVRLQFKGNVQGSGWVRLSPRPAGAYAFAESSPGCCSGHVSLVVARKRRGRVSLCWRRRPAETPGGSVGCRGVGEKSLVGLTSNSCDGGAGRGEVGVEGGRACRGVAGRAGVSVAVVSDARSRVDASYARAGQVRAGQDRQDRAGYGVEAVDIGMRRRLSHCLRAPTLWSRVQGEEHNS